MVWLSLIPFFNIIWAFFIATRIPDSLKKEFRERGQDDGSDYGRALAHAVSAGAPPSIKVSPSASGADAMFYAGFRRRSQVSDPSDSVRT